MITEIRPSVMLNACVAGIAALLVGCAPNPDPAFTAPTASSAVTNFGAAKENEKVTATVFSGVGSNASSYVASGLNDVPSCLAYGREVVHTAQDRSAVVSCSGEDGRVLSRTEVTKDSMITGRAHKAGEAVTATVYSGAGRNGTGYARGNLPSVEACMNYGREVVYLAGDRTANVSCTAPDAAVLARFECAASTATCKPVLKF